MRAIAKHFDTRASEELHYTTQGVGPWRGRVLFDDLVALFAIEKVVDPRALEAKPDSHASGTQIEDPFDVLCPLRTAIDAAEVMDGFPWRTTPYHNTEPSSCATPSALGPGLTSDGREERRVVRRGRSCVEGDDYIVEITRWKYWMTAMGRLLAYSARVAEKKTYLMFYGPVLDEDEAYVHSRTNAVTAEQRTDANGCDISEEEYRASVIFSTLGKYGITPICAPSLGAVYETDLSLVRDEPAQKVGDGIKEFIEKRLAPLRDDDDPTRNAIPASDMQAVYSKYCAREGYRRAASHVLCRELRDRGISEQFRHGILGSRNYYDAKFVDA